MEQRHTPPFYIHTFLSQVLTQTQMDREVWHDIVLVTRT